MVNSGVYSWERSKLCDKLKIFKSLIHIVNKKEEACLLLLKDKEIFEEKEIKILITI